MSDEPREPDRSTTRSSKLLLPPDALQLRGAWRGDLPANTKLLVEVGTWDGRMLHAAQVHATDSNRESRPLLCVGIDWKRKTLLEAIHTTPIEHRDRIRFVLGRAQDMHAWFSPGEIDEIWILHPEPSDRPQERAHRLISGRFLLSLAPLLSVGGAIHLKTDHAGLYAWTLGLFGLDAPAHFSDRTRDPAARDAFGRSLRVRQRDLLAENDRPTHDESLSQALKVSGQSYDFWSEVEREGAAAGVPVDHVLTRHPSGYERRFLARRRPIYAITMQRATRPSPA